MTKVKSFDDVPIFVYPGSREIEIALGTKNSVRPRKRSEMTKSKSFDDVPIFVYRGSRAVEIVPKPKKMCAIAHKNGQK